MNKPSSKSSVLPFLVILLAGCSAGGVQNGLKSTGAAIDDVSRKVGSFYNQTKNTFGKESDAKSNSTGIGFKLPLDCYDSLLLKCHEAKGPVKEIKKWSGTIVDGKEQLVPMPSSKVEYAEFDRRGYIVKSDGIIGLSHYIWNNGLLQRKETLSQSKDGVYSYVQIYHYDEDGNRSRHEMFHRGELSMTVETRYSLDEVYVSETTQSRQVKPDPRIPDSNFGDSVIKYDREGNRRFWRGQMPMINMSALQAGDTSKVGYFVPSEIKYETTLVDGGAFRKKSALRLKNGEWIPDEITWINAQHELPVEKIHYFDSNRINRYQSRYEFDGHGNWVVRRTYKAIKYLGDDKNGVPRFDWALHKIDQRDITYYDLRS